MTDLGLVKSSEKRELKKHAATIHCSNALSLLQRKVSNALLYHAYKELMSKEEHEITVKQLCRLIGYQGNNHAAIKEALKGLISTVIEWNLISDETGAENWTASSIIASVSLEGPMCYYAYSPRMKQLLHSPSMFGKIDLVIQSKFRSSYGLALYENCIRYRGLPQTKWFDMPLFKKLMGIPDGMYEVFRDFKRRVLDKAIQEVNTYSDLYVESEFVKEGRKVVRVRFKLQERAKKTRLGQPSKRLSKRDNTPEGHLTIKLTEHYGLTKTNARALIKEYSLAYIEEKMEIIEASASYKAGKVKNKTAYLISALKQDYQAEPNETSGVIPFHDAKHEIELAEAKKMVENIRRDYQQYRELTIQAALEALSPQEYQSFYDRFIEFAQPAIHTILQLQRHKYSRETVMDSPQIQALLRQYALRELDIISLISLEEYVAGLDEAKRESWHHLKSYDPEHPLILFVE